MKKIALLSLFIPLVGCSDNYHYNHNPRTVSEMIANTGDVSNTWAGKGFSLEDYKIYKQAGISLSEALPWKEAGVNAVQAAQSYPKWHNAGIDNNSAAFVVKNIPNITPDQYKQAWSALDGGFSQRGLGSLEGVNKYSVNQADLTKLKAIVYNIQQGQTPDQALQTYDQQRKAQQQAQYASHFSTSVIKACHGVPKILFLQASYSGNPYDLQGKCYVLPEPFTPMQWLSQNQVLILKEGYSNLSTPLYLESAGPIKLKPNPIIVGIQPFSYTTALGVQNIIPAFKIIGNIH